MSEREKLIAELAARFMVSFIGRGGAINDIAHANNCVKQAKAIVDGASTK